MHFLLTYGVSGGTPQQIALLTAQTTEALKRYPYYKALGNTYIIKVGSQVDFASLVTVFQKIAKESPIPFNFLATPLLPLGRSYDGWMPNIAWQEINKLSMP